MIKFDWVAIAFGTTMATIDLFMLGLLKVISKNESRMLRYMILPTVIYALQPWIFLQSLRFESLTVMNLMWDLISDVLVTLLGIFYFKEEIGPFKKLGVGLSFVSIFLMSLSDGQTLMSIFS